MTEHDKIKRDRRINDILSMKRHEWLMATKCLDFRGLPYWRIDTRNQKAIEEIRFCPPNMIRSNLRHNDAVIIDWFTDEEAGTI